MKTKFVICKNYYPINIKYVEDKYSAKYIGDFCIKNGDAWTQQPLAIFYCKEPDTTKGHTHYLAIGFKDRRVIGGKTEFSIPYITKGDSAFEDITGLQLANGKVLISCYGHDFISEGDSFIDGGRDYCRYSASEGDKLVNVIINKGKLKIKI
jgi:hypothetical protein